MMLEKHYLLEHNTSSSRHNLRWELRYKLAMAKDRNNTFTTNNNCNNKMSTKNINNHCKSTTVESINVKINHLFFIVIVYNELILFLPIDKLFSSSW
ncbi:hypothetical protein PPL_07194 [Heterostelium album PN500]|uniref:Uncharacterized protein n=1 Tax=Heterostelium pallidum (strain ATCC 26659 / Pp 5 / PN500) TaxID=670386 RepID=D3BEN0_HETP5|nr:hypothetical protein PPL_07194 [Heterostelium album PN500]EFA80361.1 hypothetical protein PPL_07194 [Heterostelium album PN500]|eukprot:XP_020432481.1 hypothetical protein PPL_07194 [Heterostelium album PN500]